MTDNQFCTMFGEAIEATDRDAYVSDWVLSSMWEADPESEIPVDRIEQVGALWDVAHLTVRQIREHTGLTQAAFGERYAVPCRTIQNWEQGTNKCPDYVRLMLAQLTGLYTRP